LSKVSALIPAYNEARTIAATVAAVRRISAVDEIIVVDDGSSDSTVTLAQEAGADVVVTGERNEGKGAALMKGMSSASGDILLFLDADLGESACHGIVLAQAVISGETDMAIAILPTVQTSGGGRSGGLGLALRLARWGIRLFTGRTMKAPLSGQRALRREILERVGKLDPGFGVEVGLTIDALRAGYRVEESPAPMTHRATGRDVHGFAHRARQFRDILMVLARRALRRSR